MVTVRTTKALDFACHSKACAPPPVGKGGSSDGGGKSGRVAATSLKRGDKVIFAQQAKTVRWVGKESKGRIPVSFETGGITDIARDQTLPRA